MDLKGKRVTVVGLARSGAAAAGAARRLNGGARTGGSVSAITTGVSCAARASAGIPCAARADGVEACGFAANYLPRIAATTTTVAAVVFGR